MAAFKAYIKHWCINSVGSCTRMVSAYPCTWQEKEHWGESSALPLAHLVPFVLLPCKVSFLIKCKRDIEVPVPGLMLLLEHILFKFCIQARSAGMMFLLPFVFANIALIRLWHAWQKCLLGFGFQVFGTSRPHCSGWDLRERKYSDGLPHYLLARDCPQVLTCSWCQGLQKEDVGICFQCSVPKSLDDDSKPSVNQFTKKFHFSVEALSFFQCFNFILFQTKIHL